MGGRGATSQSGKQSLSSKFSGDQISTHVSDYAGYSREEITSFFASKDYEVGAIFTSDGELVSVTTDYDTGSVKRGIEYLAIAAWQKVNPNKDVTFSDFHNHPVSDNLGSRLFSVDDLRVYVKRTQLYKDGTSGTPSDFFVKTQDGHEYRLKYVGGGKRKLAKFASSYKRATTKALDELSQAKADYWLNNKGADMPDEDRLSFMDERLSGWLRRNAKHYGFEYKESG